MPLSALTSDHASSRALALYPAYSLDTGFGFRINWISVWVFLVLAVAVALYARHVSGGWTRPWISVKPVWWFFLLFLVPFFGLPLLVGNLIGPRHTPGAVTGRNTAG